jgi:hypothetical protein
VLSFFVIFTESKLGFASLSPIFEAHKNPMQEAHVWGPKYYIFNKSWRAGRELAPGSIPHDDSEGKYVGFAGCLSLQDYLRGNIIKRARHILNQRGSCKYVLYVA